MGVFKRSTVSSNKDCDFRSLSKLHVGVGYARKSEGHDVGCKVLASLGTKKFNALIRKKLKTKDRRIMLLIPNL
jgi:hypothetical protein